MMINRANAIEVSTKEIERLGPVELTELLVILMQLECRKYCIPEKFIEACGNITISDGGSDVSICCSEAPSAEFFGPDTLFQVKATAMGKKNCQKELFEKSTTNLKPKLQSLFDRGGKYILFCNREGKDDRVAAIRQGLKEADRTDSDQADIESFDPRKITIWCNKYLPAVAFVRECIRQPLPLGTQTLEELSKHDGMNELQYVQPPGFEAHQRILHSVAATPKDILRIVGLSGLGKTRLLLEAFRDTPFFRMIAYIDVADFGYESESQAQLVSWARNAAGLLVVDNCPRMLHDRLCNAVQMIDGQLSLITLDFNPDEPSPKQKIISLAPSEETDLIREVLRKNFPTLDQNEVDRIANFSQGFPKIVALLKDCDFTQSSLSTLTDKELVRRQMQSLKRWFPRARSSLTSDFRDREKGIKRS